MLQAVVETDLDAIRQEVSAHGYCIIKPPGLAELCELARAEYFAAMAATAIQPPRKSFNYTDLAKGPWRKLAISSRNGVGEPYAQFLQTMYFDHLRSPYPNLNKVFTYVVELRNKLMACKDGFGNDPMSDGFWNACRVHHYPAGGGFMVMHRDTYFNAALGEYCFYQLLIPFSVKGRDFNDGGGVVIDKDGRKYNTDELGGMGSVFVYDGRTLHGVEDVDPDQIVSFTSTRGRMAIVCNPYCTVVKPEAEAENN